jgi:hypothetical protein
VFVRKLPALVVTAGLVASLTACAAGPAFVETCAPTGNAALVDAPGSLGSDPRASFPTPLVSTDVEVAELKTGDDTSIATSDAVEISISIYDGTTGEPLATQGGDLVAVELRSFVDGQFPLTQALTCSSPGSRLVVTGTAEQLFGPDALGLDPETTLVTVNDIDVAYPGQATGADQFVSGGFPSVVFAPSGQPGFTWPDGSAPTELLIAAMRQGSGETVAEGDEIAANVTAIVWNGTETFASSFENLAPGLLLVQPLGADGSGVVPGLATALVGQQVGSRMLVVVPPAEGYPAGTAPAAVGPDDTMVFVVDILAIR